LANYVRYAAGIHTTPGYVGRGQGQTYQQWLDEQAKAEAAASQPAPVVNYKPPVRGRAGSPRQAAYEQYRYNRFGTQAEIMAERAALMERNLGRPAGYTEEPAQAAYPDYGGYGYGGYGGYGGGGGGGKGTYLAGPQAGGYRAAQIPRLPDTPQWFYQMVSWNI
jgi:hypothetical protein